MADFAALSQLKTKPLLLGTLSFVCIFAPGLCALELFSPETVRNLDTIKLLVLASAITLPLVFVNTQIARELNEFGDVVESVEVGLVVGLAITVLLFGATLFAWFVLEWDARSFGVTVGVSQLALCCGVPILKGRKWRRAERERALERARESERQKSLKNIIIS